MQRRTGVFFMASRCEMIETGCDRLRRGETVISDRFLLANVWVLFK